MPVKRGQYNKFVSQAAAIDKHFSNQHPMHQYSNRMNKLTVNRAAINKLNNKRLNMLTNEKGNIKSDNSHKLWQLHDATPDCAVSTKNLSSYSKTVGENEL